MNITKEVKKFGAKVTRTDYGYRYNGLNFSLDFVGQDGEYGRVWVIDIYCPNVSREVRAYFEGSDVVERKKDVVYMCLSLDKRLSREKNNN